MHIVVEQLSKWMTVGVRVPPVGGEVTEARVGGYKSHVVRHYSQRTV